MTAQSPPKYYMPVEVVKMRSITPRQAEILTLLAQGDTCKQAAVKLGISFRTVETQVEQMKIRIGARTQSHAVAIGITSGLIEFAEIEEADEADAVGKMMGIG
jgi:DNA-binding CsgD family transcriptional regulator